MTKPKTYRPVSSGSISLRKVSVDRSLSTGRPVLCTRCNAFKSEIDFWYVRGKMRRPCKSCWVKYRKPPNKIQQSARRDWARKYRLQNSIEVFFYHAFYRRFNSQELKTKKHCTYLKKKSHILQKTKEWAKKNKNKRRMIANRYALKSRGKLLDSYIKARTIRMGIKSPSPELIQLKRLQLYGLRKINQLKQKST